MSDKKFFRSLFDPSFSNFITRKVAKVIYVIVMILLAVYLVVAALAGFALLNGYNSGMGVLVLLFSPLVALLILIIVRVGLEQAIAQVLVAENTQKMAANHEQHSHPEQP